MSNKYSVNFLFLMSKRYSLYILIILVFYIIFQINFIVPSDRINIVKGPKAVNIDIRGGQNRNKANGED